MVDTSYTTASLPLTDRAPHWDHAIGQTYFSLALQFQDPIRFEGEIHAWRMGTLSLSYLASSPLCYSRLKQHLRDQTTEQYLITIPRQSAIHFNQDGRDTICHPGTFLLEHGHKPYEFLYTQANSLWVLKVDGARLRHMLHSPDRYCALAFDAINEAGWLFASYVDLIGQQLMQGKTLPRAMLEQHLLELLICSIQGDARVLSSAESAVRHAHLVRIDNYVKQNLTDHHLNPDRVARACGISARYLHTLYRDVGRTFTEWLHEQRLERAHQVLAVRGDGQTIASIAQQWGFTDQAHFSRLYKRRFGLTPGQSRRMST